MVVFMSPSFLAYLSIFHFLSHRQTCTCSLIGFNSNFVLYLKCCFGNNPLYMDFKPIKILFCSDVILLVYAVDVLFGGLLIMLRQSTNQSQTVEWKQFVPNLLYPMAYSLPIYFLWNFIFSLLIIIAISSTYTYCLIHIWYIYVELRL